MPKAHSALKAKIADVAENVDVARAIEEYMRALDDQRDRRRALDETLSALARTPERDPQRPAVRAANLRARSLVNIGKAWLDVARALIYLAAEIVRGDRREAEAQRLFRATDPTRSPVTGGALPTNPAGEAPMAQPPAVLTHASDPDGVLASIVDRATTTLGPGVDVEFADTAAQEGQFAAVYTRDGWTATVTVEGTTAGRVLTSIAVAGPTYEGDSTTAGLGTSVDGSTPWRFPADAIGLPESPLTFSTLTLDPDRAARTLALAAATVRAPAGINEWYETGVIGDPTDWTVDRFSDDGPAEILRAALESAHRGDEEPPDDRSAN